MEGSGSNAAKPPKFAVYQNPAISAALTSSSLRPSVSTFICIISLFSVSALALLFFNARKNSFITTVNLEYRDFVRVCSMVIVTTASLFLCGTLLAFLKAISQWRGRNSIDVMTVSPSKGTKELTRLTNRQLGLLGLSPKVEPAYKESSKPPVARTSPASPSNFLVPLHQPFTGSNQSTRMSGGRSTSAGSSIHGLTTPAKQSASSVYLVPTTTSLSPASLQSQSQKISPVSDQFIASPWSNKRPTFHKEIVTEKEFEKFLADVDEKISETASKLATPPPSINGFGVASPNTISGSVNTSGTTRSTPLRPVRLSPASKKFIAPPKKDEGDLPPPMSMEESIKAFQQLGIYPQIEQWRDHLRQWFSDILVNPLLCKIENSHLKVMEAASKLGIAITISEIGNDSPGMSATTIDRTSEWKASYAVDEDGILHQLRATLVQAQALDNSMQKSSLINFQQSPQNPTANPVVQEIIDAITEHQRLHALMKGDWSKGLLPQSSIRAHYTVKRIRVIDRLTMGSSSSRFLFLSLIGLVICSCPLFSAASPESYVSPSPSPSSSSLLKLPAHEVPPPVPAAAPSPSPASAYISPPAPPPSDLDPNSTSPAPAPVRGAKNAPAPAPGVPDGEDHSSINSPSEGSSEGTSSWKKAGITLAVMGGMLVFGMGVFVYNKRQQNIRRSRYLYAARIDF